MLDQNAPRLLSCGVVILTLSLTLALPGPVLGSWTSDPNDPRGGQNPSGASGAPEHQPSSSGGGKTTSNNDDGGGKDLTNRDLSADGSWKGSDDDDDGGSRNPGSDDGGDKSTSDRDSSVPSASIYEQAMKAANAAVSAVTSMISATTERITQTYQSLTGGGGTGQATDFGNLSGGKSNQVGGGTIAQTPGGQTVRTVGSPFNNDPRIGQNPTGASGNAADQPRGGLFGPGVSGLTQAEIESKLEAAARATQVDVVGVAPDGTVTAQVTANDPALVSAPGNVPKTINPGQVTEIEVKPGDEITVEVATDVGTITRKDRPNSAGVLETIEEIKQQFTQETVAPPQTTPVPTQDPFTDLAPTDLLPPSQTGAPVDTAQLGANTPSRQAELRALEEALKAQNAAVAEQERDLAQLNVELDRALQNGQLDVASDIQAEIDAYRNAIAANTANAAAIEQQINPTPTNAVQQFEFVSPRYESAMRSRDPALTPSISPRPVANPRNVTQSTLDTLSANQRATFDAAVAAQATGAIYNDGVGGTPSNPFATVSVATLNGETRTSVRIGDTIPGTALEVTAINPGTGLVTVRDTAGNTQTIGGPEMSTSVGSGLDAATQQAVFNDYVAVRTDGSIIDPAAPTSNPTTPNETFIDRVGSAARGALSSMGIGTGVNNTNQASTPSMADRFDPTARFDDPFAGVRNQPGAEFGEVGANQTVLTEVRSMLGDDVRLSTRNIVTGETTSYALNETTGRITNLTTGAVSDTLSINGQTVTVGEAMGTGDGTGAVELTIDGQQGLYRAGDSLPIAISQPQREVRSPDDFQYSTEPSATPAAPNESPENWLSRVTNATRETFTNTVGNLFGNDDPLYGNDLGNEIAGTPNVTSSGGPTLDEFQEPVALETSGLVSQMLDSINVARDAVETTVATDPVAQQRAQELLTEAEATFNSYLDEVRTQGQVPYHVAGDTASIVRANAEVATAVAQGDIPPGVSARNNTEFWNSILADGLFNAPGGGQLATGDEAAIVAAIENGTFVPSAFDPNTWVETTLPNGETVYVPPPVTADIDGDGVDEVIPCSGVCAREIQRVARDVYGLELEIPDTDTGLAVFDALSPNSPRLAANTQTQGGVTSVSFVNDLAGCTGEPCNPTKFYTENELGELVLTGGVNPATGGRLQTASRAHVSNPHYVDYSQSVQFIARSIPPNNYQQAVAARAREIAAAEYGLQPGQSSRPAGIVPEIASSPRPTPNPDPNRGPLAVAESPRPQQNPLRQVVTASTRAIDNVLGTNLSNAPSTPQPADIPAEIDRVLGTYELNGRLAADVVVNIGNDQTLPGGREVVTVTAVDGETITVGETQYEVDVTYSPTQGGSVNLTQQPQGVTGRIGSILGNESTVTIPEWSINSPDPETGELPSAVSDRIATEQRMLYNGLVQTGAVDPQSLPLSAREGFNNVFGNTVTPAGPNESTAEMAERMAANRVTIETLENQSLESLGITPVDRSQLDGQQQRDLDDTVDAILEEINRLDELENQVRSGSGELARPELETIAQNYQTLRGAVNQANRIANGASVDVDFDQWISPVQGGRLYGRSNTYGPRCRQSGGCTPRQMSFHYGYDLYPEDPRNIDHYRVAAVQDGEVVYIRSNPNSTGSYGNQIIVRHPDGTMSRYNHIALNEGLQVGDTVQQGEIIALIDGSGTFFGQEVRMQQAQGLPLEDAILAAVDSLCETDCNNWNTDWRNHGVTPPHLDFEQVRRADGGGGRNGNPMEEVTTSLPLDDRQVVNRGVPPGEMPQVAVPRNADGTVDVYALGERAIVQETRELAAADTNQRPASPLVSSRPAIRGTLAPEISTRPVARTQQGVESSVIAMIDPPTIGETATALLQPTFSASNFGARPSFLNPNLSPTSNINPPTVTPDQDLTGNDPSPFQIITQPPQPLPENSNIATENGVANDPRNFQRGTEPTAITNPDRLSTPSVDTIPSVDTQPAPPVSELYDDAALRQVRNPAPNFNNESTGASPQQNIISPTVNITPDETQGFTNRFFNGERSVVTFTGVPNGSQLVDTTLVVDETVAAEVERRLAAGAPVSSVEQFASVNALEVRTLTVYNPEAATADTQTAPAPVGANTPEPQSEGIFAGITETFVNAWETLNPFGAPDSDTPGFQQTENGIILDSSIEAPSLQETEDFIRENTQPDVVDSAPTQPTTDATGNADTNVPAQDPTVNRAQPSGLFNQTVPSSPSVDTSAPTANPDRVPTGVTPSTDLGFLVGDPITQEMREQYPEELEDAMVGEPLTATDIENITGTRPTEASQDTESPQPADETVTEPVPATEPATTPPPATAPTPAAPTPESRGFFGRAWDGVRNTVSNFFGGDTRTDEEVWEDFRDSSRGDNDDNDRPRESEEVEQATTTQNTQETTADLIRNQNSTTGDGLFNQRTSNDTNTVTRTIATELRALATPSSPTESTMLEVTTRSETGSTLDQKMVRVATGETLYVINETTGDEEAYTLTLTDDELTLVPANGAPAIAVNTGASTVLTQTQAPFIERTRTTEISILDTIDNTDETRALLSVTQQLDTGEVVDRSVRDVNVNTPIEVVNEETNQTTTYVPRQISSGGVTLEELTTGRTFRSTPAEPVITTTTYEVPFTSQQNRQRVSFEPPVQVMTENERLRATEPGVQQYNEAGLDNLATTEPDGFFSRLASFFASFFGGEPQQPAETVTPGSTDPYFPTATQ